MSTKWSSQILGTKTADFGDLLKDEYAVVLLQGKNIFNDMIYCYIKVSLPNIKKLQAALTSENPFNPSDFGTLIASGKGQPPEEVRAEIALTYPMLDTPRPLAAPANESAPMVKKNWDEY